MNGQKIQRTGLKWPTLIVAIFQINCSFGAQPENLDQIFEFIEDSEYEIRQAKEGIYKAANRKQNLRFTLAADKFEVEPRDFGDGRAKPWNLTMQFESASKGAMPITADGQQPT